MTIIPLAATLAQYRPSSPLRQCRVCGKKRWHPR